jgi:anti-anti-sigma factor
MNQSSVIIKSVIIKQFPRELSAGSCRRFLRELKSELAEVYRPQMVFDFAGVDRMTAAGVDLLLRCVTEIAQCDGEVKLAAAGPQTSLVLELTQMSEVIESFDSVEEAVASWDLLHSHQVLAPVQPNGQPAESQAA